MGTLDLRADVGGNRVGVLDVGLDARTTAPPPEIHARALGFDVRSTGVVCVADVTHIAMPCMHRRERATRGPGGDTVHFERDVGKHIILPSTH